MLIDPAPQIISTLATLPCYKLNLDSGGLVIVLEMGSDGGIIMKGLPSDDGDSALDSTGLR